MNNTKNHPDSRDTVDDYTVIKANNEYYSVDSQDILKALNSHHHKIKSLQIASSSFGINGYHFTIKTASSFIAGDYSFVEYDLHYEHPSAEIEGIFFYIYYTDSGKIAARIYERVKLDCNGNFKLHLLYNPLDSNHNRLNLHFYSIITSSLRSNKTLELIKPHIDVLQECVANLPCYEDLDIEPPHNDDEVVFLPIEGTYNAKFFSRLFLLRHHSIENIIISEFDMIQYQIPVKANNENLILLIYGTHLLEDIFSPEMLTNPIGSSLCDQINSSIRERSSIVNSILWIRELVGKETKDRDLITHDTLYIKYEQLVSILYSWIDSTINEAKRAYRKSNYGQVKWVSEYKLFSLVSLWYPDALFQFSPPWLGKQSIDIYLPSKRIGIEYQGRQHFESVNYFGGEEHLLENKRRDQEKLHLCKENDVTLLYWEYYQKVSFSAVSAFLNKKPDEIVSQLECFNPMPVVTVLEKIQTYTQLEISRKAEEKKVAQSHLTQVVRQYSNTGEYLAEYRTIKEAATQSGTNPTSIHKCLTGNRKTAGGYIWRKEKKENRPQAIVVVLNETHNNPPEDNNGLPKPVVQIDPISGEVIMIHDSINQAANSVGVHSKGIHDAIKGKQKTAGGYLWQFTNKDKKSNS